MNKKKGFVILEAFLVMIVLQGLRALGEWLLRPYVSESILGRKMCTMSLMLILTGVLVIYVGLRKQEFSLCPERFTRPYWVVTVIVLLIYISCPSNFTQGIPAILTLLYGSIVTPVYEELLFRGYFWNRFESVMEKEISVYAWNVGLFTLWHLGYMMEHVMTGNWNAVLWKLAAGLGYALILGAIRLKTKNCYSTILLHGVMNVFMI